MLKKIITLFWTLTGLSLNAPILGEIIETSRIETVRDYISSDTMVLFNITGTLYEPSTTLAEHQWRDYFAERVELLISNSEIGQKLINKVKNEIVQKIPKKSVEEITPRLISELQKEKIPVFGITKKQMSTAYADNFGFITSHHLLSIGIDLEKTQIYSQIPEKNSEFYSFAYGIIFSNKKPVEVALISFLDNNHYTHPHIIMVDNSQKSLESVEAALTSRNLTFIGLRYNPTDSHLANFNHILGIIEFIAFINEDKILSDEEAMEILLSNPDIDYKLCLDNLIIKMATDY